MVHTTPAKCCDDKTREFKRECKRRKSETACITEVVTLEEELFCHANGEPDYHKSLELLNHSSEEVNSRRQQANTLFWAIYGALGGGIALIGYSFLQIPRRPQQYETLSILLLEVMAYIVCVHWIQILKQYELVSWTGIQLRTAIEALLPVRVFTSQYGLCAANNYKPISRIERQICEAFQLMTALALVVTIFYGAYMTADNQWDAAVKEARESKK